MAAPALGLSPADLTGIRTSLAAGRRPKVVFTARAGQMVGHAGQVVELADPASTDDWIVVRFGRDELPFAPADLAVPGRGRGRISALGRTTAGRGAQTPVSSPRSVAVGDGAAVPTPAASKAPAVTKPDVTKPAVTKPAVTKPAVTKPAVTEPEAATVTAAKATAKLTAAKVTAAKVTAAKVTAAKVTAATRSVKAAAPLTVTLTYADQRWTVAAQHGAKTLAKPAVLPPADAVKVLAVVDLRSVHDAIAAIMKAERAEAQRRADQLRAELAAVESRLAELSSRP